MKVSQIQGHKKIKIKKCIGFRQQYKFNLDTINKLIKMQQNVQSEQFVQVAEYSQQRNSNPSKIPDSQILHNHRSTASFCQNPIHLQIHQPKQQLNKQHSNELKKIEEEIKRQKELIEKLRLEKQQIQANMNKSYLSLSPGHLDSKNSNVQPQNDDLLETKTQADFSLLENRKIIAIKQLQTQQEKYRQNIRKMQIKKSQMKRKLKQDPQIPIRIMDFKDLQKKKQFKENEHQNPAKSDSIQKVYASKKQQSQKIDNFQQLVDPTYIEAQSKRPKQEKLQENQNLCANPDQIKNSEVSQKGSDLINKSKFSQKKSNKKIEEVNPHQNNSRVSENSNKRYSVKKSTVIVPESNDSIKEIQDRRERKSQKLSSQKQSKHESVHEINLEPQIQQKSKSRFSYAKKEKHQEPQNSHQFQSHKEKQESVQQSQKDKNINSQKHAQKSIRSQKIQNTEELAIQKISGKQMSSSAKSKKTQKVELMYVPHAPKQQSHKSFKKTDKSIQWSQIDMSMYGKTNEVPHSHNNSQLLSEINQQNNPLKQETEESRVSNQMQIIQANMKKNKIQDKKLVQQNFYENKVSDKFSNLAPRNSSKGKSEKQSIHSKTNQSKGSFFAGSRQGSVKQRAERYDQFHRQHSLNNKKVQSKKLIMQNLNSVSGSKQPSYRSRKSNPISNLSASRSKAQTVAINDSKPLSKAGKSQIVRNQDLGMNGSKVLISKKEITLLHTQIQKLEEKLITIQARQQKLAHQKEEELVKLQIIAAEEEKLVQEAHKSRIVIQNEQKNEFQNLLVDILIPERQSVSRQLALPDQKNPEATELQLKEDAKNQANMEKSFVNEKVNIQKEINQIAEIEKKFNFEKQQLMEEINKLRKTIRQLQIEKIKSIDHNQTITSKDDKSKRPDSELNQFGFIVHQNKENKTINPVLIGDQEESATVPIGKIVKNNSPEKNTSRLIQNLDSRNKSIDRKFRINISKKSSIMSENFLVKQQDSVQMLAKMSSLNYDDEGNEQLERKKKESYPINAKDGYVVVSPDHPHQESNLYKNDYNGSPQKSQVKLPEISDSKIRRAEMTKEEILEKFHRTNREFNNFIESSRIINETNSSMSSQNNFFFDKTHSSAFSHKKVVQQDEEDNPQATKFLNKMSDSNLDLHKDSSKTDFQQNFTKIIENIKNQATEENESGDELQQIEVRDVQMPGLSKTPDITYDQDQLIKLAQDTFKEFGIEVNYDDADFNMKKYKNCVIFTKGTETILWHYNGKFYIGGWKGKQDGSGQKTGYGVQIVPEKHIYKGQFMNGKKHGTGIMKSINGNIYDGQWIEGIKYGQGVYYDSTTKVVYSGQWKDGKKNGFGILKFSEKQYYKGTFIKSVKDGYGTEVFINGDKYKGEYRKGKFHGKGKYTWGNTSCFEGDFLEGMRHGNGSWKSSKINGDIYVGGYQNDKKSGYGRYIWSNGCIYQGNFAQDVKHGKGRLIYTDGRQIKGVWQQGRLLEAVTQSPKQYNQQDILKRGNNNNNRIRVQ